jgi:hypothetical protein
MLAVASKVMKSKTLWKSVSFLNHLSDLHLMELEKAWLRSVTHFMPVIHTTSVYR